MTPTRLAVHAPNRGHRGPFARRHFRSAAVALAQPPADAKRLAETKAHYTKYEYRIPMRDGVNGCLRPFTCRRIKAANTRSCSRGRRTACGRTGPTSIARCWAPRWRSIKRATFSRCRTCAAAACPRANSSTCGPTFRAEEGPKDDRRDERHLRHDRLAGKARGEQQRQSRYDWDLLSRLLHGGGNDRRRIRHSRPPRRRPRSPIGSSATTGTTTARFTWGTAFNFLSIFDRPRSEARSNSSNDEISTPRRPTSTAYYLKLGPLKHGKRPPVQGADGLLEGDRAARHIR